MHTDYKVNGLFGAKLSRFVYRETVSHVFDPSIVQVACKDNDRNSGQTSNCWFAAQSTIRLR